MSDPCRRESKHRLSKPCRKRRGAERRRRVVMQSVGDSSLYVVKTSALGIDPGRWARLITASVGEPWEDLEPCLPVRRPGAVASLIGDSFALPGPASQSLWLVSGCARP